MALEHLVVRLTAKANFLGLLDAAFSVDPQPPERGEKILGWDGYGERLAPVVWVPAEVVQQADVSGEFVAETLGGLEVASFDQQAGVFDPRQALEE